MKTHSKRKTNKKVSMTLPPKWLRILIPSILIVAWFAMAGFGGTYFGRIDEVSKLDMAAFLPNSAEATKVNSQLENFSTENKGSIPAILVFEAKEDKILGADEKTAIDLVKEELSKESWMKGEISPAVVSEDKKAAILIAPLDQDADTKELLPEIKSSMEDRVSNTTAHITGPAGFSADLSEAFSGIDGLLLVVALAVVFVILLIVYRSPILPFMVLATSLAALAASIFVVWNMANAEWLVLNGQTQGILFILVIGAATDYSLLYVSRYREELRAHKKSWHATTRALRASLEPVLASGGTVIAGLLCLLLSDLESNKALGPVGSVGILFAMASALTLLPAMLTMAGRASFWPFTPAYNPKSTSNKVANQSKLWKKVAAFVSWRPRLVWVSATVLLLVAALGVLQLRADGASQADMVLSESSARNGQAVLDKHFAGGLGTPIQVIAPVDSIDKAVKELEKHPLIDSVTVAATGTDAGQKPVGKQEEQLKSTILSEINTEVSSQKEQIRSEIASSAPALPAEALDQVVLQATANIPSAEELAKSAYPFKDARPNVYEGNVLLSATLKVSSEDNEAKAAIAPLRESLRAVDEKILVGGNTAIQVDSNTAAIHDRTLIIPVILVAITIILMLLLRSILAPLFLLLTTVISFGTAIGVAALLFNHVWDFPGADPSVILYAFVFLVALGIDYNIFLMTRVREESLKIGTRKGVLKGLVVTGGVITSAGIVLAATFAALAVIPILFLVQLAFIVSFGVLLDTIIVRSLLVPSFILDVGSRIWWPSKKLTHKD